MSKKEELKDEEYSEMTVEEFEYLKFRGVDNLASILIIVMCYGVGLTMFLDSFADIYLKIRLMNVVVVMPVIIYCLSLYYKKIHGLESNNVFYIVKKILLYFIFDIISIIFWSLIFDSSNLYSVPFLILTAVLSALVIIYLTFLALMITYVFKGLNSEINILKKENKAIFNMNTVKMLPVCWLLLIHVFLLLNVYMELFRGMGVLDMAVQIVTYSITWVLSLLISVQGILCSLYNIKLSSVFKYALLSITLVSLVIYGPYVQWILPKILLFAITGVIFGVSLNFLLNLIIKLGKRR